MAKIVKEFHFPRNKSGKKNGTKKFANYLEFYASLVPKFVLNSNHSLEIYEGLSENVKARLACRTDT